MEQRTRNYLSNAGRNQRFAGSLLFQYIQSSSSQPPIDQPPELLWSVVAAFYSAVHYVNAYLWEIRRHSPSDHSDREWQIDRDPALRTIAESYGLLKDWSLQGRYDPLPRITDADAQQAIDELTLIADLVKRELRER